MIRGGSIYDNNKYKVVVFFYELPYYTFETDKTPYPIIHSKMQFYRLLCWLQQFKNKILSSSLNKINQTNFMKCCIRLINFILLNGSSGLTQWANYKIPKNQFSFFRLQFLYTLLHSAVATTKIIILKMHLQRLG